VIRLILFLVLIPVPIAYAQTPIPPDKLAEVSRLFEDFNKRSTLHCSMEHFDPFLDFTFRYDAGFLINVHPEEFTSGTKFGAFLRITPEGGKPVFFSEGYEIPPIPAMMAKTLSARELKKIELQTSVGFAVGDGRYAVDLMLADTRERTCRAHWSLKTPKHNYPLSLPANTVTAIEQGRDGTMWFATANGVASYSQGRWHSYTAQNGVPPGRINCLFAAETGELWVGADQGLAFIVNGVAHAPASNPPLFRESIFGIAADRDDFLWIRTSSQILRIRRAELVSSSGNSISVRQFGIDDGLPTVARYGSAWAS